MDGALSSPLSSPAQHIARLIQVWRPEGKRVLDIGCGDGSFMNELTELGAECHGVEFTDESLANARRNGIAPDHLVRGDGPHLPYEDASFDAVTFVFSLHHAPAPDRAPILAEAARILRPGGHLTVFEPQVHGAMTETIKSIEDETVVRTETQALLAGDLPWFELIICEDYDLTRRIASVEALIARVVAADPTRAARARDPDIVAAVRARFAELAVRTNDGELELTQPTLHISFKRQSSAEPA